MTPSEIGAAHRTSGPVEPIPDSAARIIAELQSRDSLKTQFLANTYFFDEAAAEVAIERMIAMSDEELHRMGGNARAWFLRNDREFAARLRTALEPLFD